jgi:hypothetical protein
MEEVVHAAIHHATQFVAHLRAIRDDSVERALTGIDDEIQKTSSLQALGVFQETHQRTARLGDPLCWLNVHDMARIDWTLRSPGS